MCNRYSITVVDEAVEGIIGVKLVGKIHFSSVGFIRLLALEIIFMGTE